MKLPMNQYPLATRHYFSTIGIKCILEKLGSSKSAGPYNSYPLSHSEAIRAAKCLLNYSLSFLRRNFNYLYSDWFKNTYIYKKSDCSVL